MAVNDGDVDVRRAARKAIENLDAAVAARETAKLREALEGPLKQLKAKEAEKRIKALEQIAAFGKKANEIAGEQLIDAMADKVAEVRVAASETLEKVNPKVHPHVFTILHGMNKHGAISSLAQLGSDAGIAIPLLLYLNNNPSAGSLGYQDLFPFIAKIGPKDKRFAAAVITSVSAPNPRGDNTLQSRRIAGIAQLPVIEAENAEKVKALVAAMDDGFQLLHVVETLEGYGKDAAPALPLLKKLKVSPNDTLRNAAFRAIAKIE